MYSALFNVSAHDWVHVGTACYLQRSSAMHGSVYIGNMHFVVSLGCRKGVQCLHSRLN